VVDGGVLSLQIYYWRFWKIHDCLLPNSAPDTKYGKKKNMIKEQELMI